MNLRHLAAVTTFAALSLVSVPRFSLAADTGTGDGNPTPFYVGGLIGVGLPAGTDVEVDSGLAYGGTVGWNLLPNTGIALTYLHDNFKTTLGDLDYHVDKYLAEVNFLSVTMLGFDFGVHAGPVKTDVAGFSSTDLGLGGHLAFDVKLIPQLSVGVTGYWTYIFADDKYSTVDILGAVKVWF